MAKDPEIERLRKDRARQEELRQEQAMRSTESRLKIEADKAREYLKDVDKAAYVKQTDEAARLADRDTSDTPKTNPLLDKLRSQPSKGKGFRKRGERDREPER